MAHAELIRLCMWLHKHTSIKGGNLCRISRFMTICFEYPANCGICVRHDIKEDKWDRKRDESNRKNISIPRRLP